MEDDVDRAVIDGWDESSECGAETEGDGIAEGET